MAVVLHLGRPVQHAASGHKVQADEVGAGNLQHLPAARLGAQGVQPGLGIAFDHTGQALSHRHGPRGFAFLRQHRPRLHRLQGGLVQHRDIGLALFLDDAVARRLHPGRWRHLVGHAIVQRHLLVGIHAVHQAQHRHAQQPPGCRTVRLAHGGLLLQQLQQLAGIGQHELALAVGPGRAQPGQRQQRGVVDSHQPQPGHAPGLGRILLGRAQGRDRAHREQRRAGPQELALAGVLAHRPRQGRLAQPGRQGGPQRRRTAKVLGIVDRQGLEGVLVPGGAAPVEHGMPQPAHLVLIPGRGTERLHQLLQQAGAGAFQVAMGKQDGGLFQVWVGLSPTAHREAETAKAHRG